MSAPRKEKEMAETKADLIKKAKGLGIEHISTKNTMVELREMIKEADPKKHNKEELPTEGHEAKVAKAGKRSAKGLAEAEEKAEKEARKTGDTDLDSKDIKKPKIVQKTKSKLERSGKKLREATKLVDKDKNLGLKEAIDLATKTSTTKFDSTVELHIRLNVDPKQADQNIREIVVLPEGTGKNVRVAVFGDAEDVAAAKKAGADISGSDEFLQQLDKGVINFDVLIANPQVMARLGKYARVLGPKGLMPNPKSGTVTKDVAKAIKESKAGKVELRVDDSGIIHLGIGKVSFGTDKLFNNAQQVFASTKSAKPASLKGNYVNTIHVTTSMGPSIQVMNSEL